MFFFFVVVTRLYIAKIETKEILILLIYYLLTLTLSDKPFYEYFVISFHLNLTKLQDELSIQLIVQEVPEQPKNLRINSQQSRSLQLTWSQPFAGNSPIEECHIYYKQITGQF